MLEIEGYILISLLNYSEWQLKAMIIRVNELISNLF